MTESRRTKGRPKGRTTHDDSQPLCEMADLIATNPKLPPKTAARQVAPRYLGRVSLDSVVHRLAAKWKEQSVVLLSQARKRQDDQRPVHYVGSVGARGYLPANGRLPGLGYGYLYGQESSASSYLARRAESVIEQYMENERSRQRMMDAAMMPSGSQRLQDTMERSLRQADELRRLELLARGVWPYRS